MIAQHLEKGQIIESPDTYHIFTFGSGSANRALKSAGYTVHSFSNFNSLVSHRGQEPPRVIIVRSTAVVAVKIEAVVSKVRSIWPLVDVIVWAPRCSADLVLAVLKAGAKDVVLEDSSELLTQVVAETLKAQVLLPRMGEQHKSMAHGQTKLGTMVSQSPKMWDSFRLCEQVAATEATVLLQGETGTGKELMARAIHRLSHRKGRFVAVNCAGTPEGLIDSELFGHVKGAFTGATHDKKGLFQHAAAGTMFLDEIGNMPMNSQHHLLRVLQEGTFRVVGDHTETPTDARIIAAASQDLERLSESNRFREDLFYRLDVVRITIPPLRERPEDIIFLFHHFLKKIAKRYDISRPELSNRLIDALLEFDWPGNVRQLENVTERLLLTNSGGELTANSFRRLTKTRRKRTSDLHQAGSLAAMRYRVDTEKPFDVAIDVVIQGAEISYLKHHLTQNQGRINKTAEATGMNRRTLLRKMQKYGLDKKEFAPAGNAGKSS